MKSEKNYSFFKEMQNFIKPYKKRYLLSVILSSCSVLCELLSYSFVGIIAAHIFKGTGNKNTLLALILVVICKMVNVILLNFSTLISHKAAYLTLRDIRYAVCDKFIRIPMGYFDKNSSGKLKTIMTDRIEDVEKTLAHLLPEMTANLIIPAAMIIWLSIINIKLTGIIILWIIIGLGIGLLIMIGYKKKYEGQVLVQKNMNQAVIEYVKGIDVIKTFNQEESSYMKYKDAISAHAEYSISWMRSTQIFASLSYSIAPVSIFPVIVMGLIFLSKGVITEQSLFIFMMISLGIFNPIIKASSYFDQIAQMGTIAKEIKEILEYTELTRSQNSNIKERKNYNIEFKNLKFSYGENKNIIDGVNLEIKENTITAIVGKSGSGKSTLVKLLAGFWDFNQGDIKIGNTSIKNYSLDDLNFLISYVDQNTFLFDESILENIRIGKREACMEEVINAAKKAECHDFIMNLPNGYKSFAGDKLSGGEKQRIAIARAILKNSPILILDEATASTDIENEEKIQQALAAAAKNKTVIVITHKINTIINAHKIIYMENGKIGASGNHKELLKTCSEYKKLWDLAN